MIRLSGFIFLAFCLGACATPQVSCPAALHGTHVAQLYFGRNIGAAEGVSEEQWRAFFDAEVTPRFPEGLSVSEAQGQWKGANGVIVRERSKVLTIVLSGASAEEEKLQAIRAAYKAQFKQDAVMEIESGVCAGF